MGRVPHLCLARSKELPLAYRGRRCSLPHPRGRSGMRRRRRGGRGRCRHRIRGSSVVRGREAGAPAARWPRRRSTGSSCVSAQSPRSSEAQPRNAGCQCSPSHRGFDCRRVSRSSRPKGRSLHPPDPDHRRDPLDLRRFGSHRDVAPAQAHRIVGLRFHPRISPRRPESGLARSVLR